MVRTADGALAVDRTQVIEVAAQARTRVLLAGDLAGAAPSRPSLLERLAGRLRRTGDAVVTTSSRPGRVWRVADMLVTAWSARSHVDVAVVEVHGREGLKRAEVLTGMLARAGVPVVHLLRGARLADVAAEEPARLRRLLASGSASVALTGHLYEALEHVGGVTEVIADPVESSAYAFRERRHLKPRVLWVCGDGPLGDPADAATALAALCGQHEGVELTVVALPGSRAAAGGAREATTARGVEAGLHLADSRRPPPTSELLATHDVFVNAVDVDDAPIGLAEAMAAGLCVVSVDWGGAPYLVADGVDGLLVRPRDPAGVAAAVARLLSDPDLAEGLSRAARRRAETFDWSRALPRWRGLLARAVTRGGDRA